MDSATESLIERLKAATMGFDWADLPDDAAIPAVPLLRQAATELEALRSRCERMERERDEARDASRKMHRRVQLAEAVNQSVESILAGWKRVLSDEKGRKNSRYYEFHLFGMALWDIIRIREKLSASALQQGGKAE